jgi:hypothetical protein
MPFCLPGRAEPECPPPKEESQLAKLLSIMILKNTDGEDSEILYLQLCKSFVEWAAVDCFQIMCNREQFTAG